MTDAFELATPADWAAIAALLARTRMGARVPIAVERRVGEAEAFPVIRGRAFGVVARRAGAVVGYAHARIETRRVPRGDALDDEQLLYFGDFRVDTGVRRGGIGRRLLDLVAAVARDAGVERGFCLVNEGNEPILRLLAGATCRLRGEPVHTFTTATRLVLRRPRGARPPREPDHAPPVTPWAPDDEAYAELARALSSAPLAPSVGGSDLKAFAARHPALRFHPASEGAARVGFATWNQREIRRVHLPSDTFAMRALRRAWALASPWTGAHAAPPASDTWSGVEVTLTPRVPWGATFERELVRAAWGSGAHFANVVERDGRLDGPCTRMRTHVVALGVDGASHGLASLSEASRPPYVDLAFL